MDYSFAIQQFALYLTIAHVIFLTGYLILKAVWGKNSPFSKLEVFIITPAAGLIAVNFLMLLLGKIGISITRTSIITTLIAFVSICFLTYRIRHHKKIEVKEKNTLTFSRLQFAAIILIIFASIFIKTIYLSDAILPTSTDLGHHMYWAKTIVASGEIPTYEKVDVGMDLKLTEPQPIADFIVGEHLIFAAISLISGIDFISYFPTLLLFLFHIMGILSLFILALQFFKNSPQAKNIAIATLFFAGPLYALASPQMKFVSGGVIGNTIGNFLIPLTIYFFLRALQEKSSSLLSFAFFILFGLIYTHHLSTLVFLFAVFFSGIFFLLLNARKLWPFIKDWIRLFFKPSVIAVLIMGILFIFFIYTPTYLNIQAVDTAVGAPSKTTRIGLTPNELAVNAGEIRMALGILGLFLLLISKKRASYQNIILLGWTISLMIMSIKPGWIFINIPSNRVASYIVFPLAILSGYAFIYLFNEIKALDSKIQYLRPNFTLAVFILLVTFAFSDGFRDNAFTLNTTSDPTAVLETYAAATYLNSKTSSSDIILKDHNYLAADSWIKLFFARGYAYPLSRGYFKRYEDETKKREQCTNLMISTPNTPEAEKCFTGTRTNYLMVNPNMDSVQFRKSKIFWQVYSDKDIAIFYKNN